MSGSGATCFGLFETEEARDEAAEACPSNWWHLATVLC
jgi:4-diphosphocytidyl-2-C-methyl-D-erythritol kinase